MSAVARLAVFAVGLLVAFGAAVGIGRAVGPVDVGGAEAHGGSGHAQDVGHEADHPAGTASPTPRVDWPRARTATACRC